MYCDDSHGDIKQPRHKQQDNKSNIQHEDDDDEDEQSPGESGEGVGKDDKYFWGEES